jgi:hypothetical protein
MPAMLCPHGENVRLGGIVLAAIGSPVAPSGLLPSHADIAYIEVNGIYRNFVALLMPICGFNQKRKRNFSLFSKRECNISSVNLW